MSGTIYKEEVINTPLSYGAVRLSAWRRCGPVTAPACTHSQKEERHVMTTK